MELVFSKYFGSFFYFAFCFDFGAGVPTSSLTLDSAPLLVPSTLLFSFSIRLVPFRRSASLFVRYPRPRSISYSTPSEPPFSETNRQTTIRIVSVQYAF